MKNSTRHKRYLRMVSITLIAVSLMQGCSPDFLEQNTADASFEEGVLTLDYEAEIVTWQEVGDAKKATFLDKIHGMAHASHSKVHAEVYEDGTSAWRIEKLEPKHNVKVPDQTPADPSPQTKLTRIDRSGKGYFYSNTGTLLSEHDVPVQSCKELLERFKEGQNPSVAYSLVGVQGQQAVSEIITAAKANGAEVERLADGNISIRTAMPKTSFKNGRATVDEYTGVDIYNEKRRLLIGSRLYDKANKLVTEVFYGYRKANNKNKIEPSVIYQKTYTVDPVTGGAKTSVTNTYFETISAKTKIKS